MREIYLTTVIAVLFLSCNKEAGPGGTSSISGVVYGVDHADASAEKTNIIVPDGDLIEHGDYWILNSPTGHNQYYIWYNNTSWLTDGNPNLAGRTGIQIDYAYSSTNLELAQMTFDSLQQKASADFVFSLSVDIIQAISKYAGACVDADEMSSNFEFDIEVQGKSSFVSASNPVIDEKVYIVYGDNPSYGDIVRTGGNGDYTFNQLTKGDYTVYIVSKDTSLLEEVDIIEQTVTIEKNNSTIILDDFNILY